MEGRPVSGQEGQEGLFASAVWDEPTQSYIVKVVNTSDRAQPLLLDFKGMKKARLAEGICTTLHSDNPDAENTLDAPATITPQESRVTVTDGRSVSTEIGPMTFAVYRFVKAGK